MILADAATPDTFGAITTGIGIGIGVIVAVVRQLDKSALTKVAEEHRQNAENWKRRCRRMKKRLDSLEQKSLTVEQRLLQVEMEQKLAKLAATPAQKAGGTP